MTESGFGPLRIAVNTLAVGDAQRGSKRMLVSLVDAMVRNRADERIVLFTSAHNEHLFVDAARHDAVEVCRVDVARDHPIARVVAEQLQIPHMAARAADVLLVPSDVGVLRCAVPQVVNLWSHLAIPGVRETNPLAVDAGESSSLRDAYHRALLRPSLRRVDRVLAISSYLASEAEAAFGVDVEAVHLGADPPTLSGDTGQESASTVAQSAADPVLLFVGTLYPYKNVRQLIDAHARLLADGSRRATVVVVGSDPDGGQAPTLMRRAARLGTAGSVRVLTDVDDEELDRLYSCASCLVLTSYGEGFGLPVVEAMARGLPVIASDRMSLPEVVSDAGLLVDPTDVGALEMALRRVLDEVGLAASLRARGLRRAGELTWDATGRRYLDVLRSAAGR
jgi:glycosyltransferase involved in cell wall biosynthesis